MRVVEVNSMDGLPGLRLAWTSLLSETAGASFHQSCRWLEALFPHHPSPSRLRVLLVTGGGEALGILPLVATSHATQFGSVRVLGYPGDAWSPYQGPIGPHPAATLMAALRYLAAQEDWDVLELAGVRRGGADDYRTRTALEVAKMGYHEQCQSPCAVIDLQPTLLAERIARLPQPPRVESAPRNQVRTSRAAMTYQRYRPRGARYDDAEPHWALFDSCLALHRANLQEAAADETLLRDIHAAACHSGAADLNVVYDGQQLQACCYNVHLGGTLLTLFSGGRTAPRSDRLQSIGFDRQADNRACPHLLRSMLRDSIERQGDERWLPDVPLAGFAAPSLQLDRSRFIHDRRRGGSRLLGQLEAWLPLPTLRLSTSRRPV